MLTPNYVKNIPNGILNVMHDVELDMLYSLGKRMSKFGKITGSMEWQILKAQQLGILRDDLTKAVAKYSNKTLMEVQRAFNDSGITAVKYLDTLKKMAIEQGLEKVGKYGLTDSMVNILQAGADRAINIQNLTNTKCVQNTLQTFTNTLDKAFLSVSTGVSDITSATRQAMNDIAKQGISVVEYTSSGKLIKYSVEGATRRNILTSVNQTTMRVQKEYYDTLDCGLVETTSHAGARPEHEAWQGRVFYWGKPVKGYDNFEVVCGYGQVDGIGGINCYHNFFPFYEGISQRSFSEDPSKELGIDNEKHYEMQQKQRMLERQVREAKKELAIYQGAGNGFEAEIQACKDKVSQAQFNVRKFVESNSKFLARDYSREAIASGLKAILKPPPIVKIVKPTHIVNNTNSTIFNAKTPQEAKYQAEANKIAIYVDYNHVKNVDNLNLFNEEVYRLEQKYAVYRNGHAGYFNTNDSVSLKSSAMARASGSTLQINPTYFNSVKPIISNNWDANKYLNDALWYKDYIARTPLINHKSDIKWMHKMETYAKCKRWSTAVSNNGTMADYIKRVITHEYGHTISDRICGLINKSLKTYNITDAEATIRGQKILNAFMRAKRTGEIAEISAYANESVHEFFAEVFSMYECGEKLPQFILDMLKEVLS